MTSWTRIATRLRVPLGFVFAFAYLWFAHPIWISILAGAGFILLGLGIRASASGHIRKNAQLATTGPQLSAPAFTPVVPSCRVRSMDGTSHGICFD